MHKASEDNINCSTSFRDSLTKINFGYDALNNIETKLKKYQNENKIDYNLSSNQNNNDQLTNKYTQANNSKPIQSHYECPDLPVHFQKRKNTESEQGSQYQTINSPKSDNQACNYFIFCYKK